MMGVITRCRQTLAFQSSHIRTLLVVHSFLIIETSDINYLIQNTVEISLFECSLENYSRRNVRNKLSIHLRHDSDIPGL